VLSLDPAVGDFESGDVLIGGKKILAVGRSLNATAAGVDASGMIVMPGFVDTHHHQYETILRGILADGVLGSPNDGKKTYQG
jgi:5-methylthioadenosine/S-adenosylhomocysteine deaminase